MGSESEVKIRLLEPTATFRERLSRAGATLRKARYFEDNLLYDTEDLSLREKGRLLRVRRIGQDGLLTFKGPAESDGRHKVREEIESAVADPEAVMALLRALAYRVQFRYQKYRESYSFSGCIVEIDETPMGDFIEIEGPPGRIDAAAGKLGFCEVDYITEDYLTLFEHYCRRTGRDVSSGMVFQATPAEPGESFFRGAKK